LIEPINRHDVPGYHLYSPARAAKTITAVSAASGASNLKMMLDCYHVARMGGDPAETYRRHRNVIGHVQFAGVPDRGDPATGQVDYAVLLPALVEAGYRGFFGAEYRPEGKTEDSLGWLAKVTETLPD
jgi:hydroxypyruvate isomerase